MRIAWAITGAGHLLKESVEVIESLAKSHEITILLSASGEEVLKMYGLYNRLVNITGGRYRELVSDSSQKYSYPLTGRFSLGKYDLLVVSPATANTVSKIVYGISDNLVTNAVAQSGKGAVEVAIVPVDLKEGPVDTVLPSKLELNKCTKCSTCDAAIACPNNAITPYEEIDLLKCTGCGICADACPYGAISGGKIVTIYMRAIDIENTKKLDDFKGLTVFKSPDDIEF
ncbi:dihydromethanopterin reductase (acceptor) [Methanobrevibacter sp. DSM 116169]|uniref:dihydromethanopterin reductase (acceptor) n=1 Tax=Methanobrevibacter sp. DSM 116169 TaxID=3242727 RepID=UPI0038FCAD92